MGSEDRMRAVQAMQDFIARHARDPEFSAAQFNRAFPYSKRHIDRMFFEFTGHTPAEYIRAVRLTDGAQRLLEGGQNVLDVALESGFSSHEGFARAFARRFGVLPDRYRRNPVPIPLFVQYPVRAHYTYQNHKERLQMNEGMLICTVTPVHRPARKLVVLRSERARDYWTFCEEKGCEWEGLLNSVPGKLDSAALAELPARCVRPGTSPICAAVEAPESLDAACLPEGYELIGLGPCDMLFFETEPYEVEEDFGAAIDAALKVAERYDPSRFGYAYDFEAGPRLNFGADRAAGARIALPARKL